MTFIICITNGNIIIITIYSYTKKTIIAVSTIYFSINDIEITGDTAAELAILVSWTISDNSGGYNIYRSENNGAFLYTGSTGSGQLSYIDADEDLILGNTYAYKISSYDFWHTSESVKSIASSGIDFFLALSNNRLM